MRMSEKNDLVLAALFEIQARSKNVLKDGKNKPQDYKFASFEAVLKELHDRVLAAGCTLTASAEFITSSTSMMKNGSEYARVLLKITTRMTHLESGQWVEVDSVGEGFDGGDKSSYKAMTGARKYGLAMLGFIYTTNDPEEANAYDKLHPKNKQDDGESTPPPRAGDEVDDLEELLG